MERKIDMTANRTYFTPIRLFVFILLMILLWMLLVPHAKAAAGIRRTVNFQGKLVNKADGTNITDGSYSFTFKFYDASSAGTQLPSGAAWSETQTLTVTNGIFRAELGSSTVIPTTMDFNADNIYLDITFNGETFGSRVRMTAVPYAFNAEKVGGLTVTSTTGTLTVPNGKTITFGDDFTTSGANPLTLTTTGTTNATLPTGTITLVDLASTQTLTSKSIGSTGLTFSGATTDITTGTNEDFNIVANGTGKVGIGTTSPASFFDVNGKLNVLSGGNVGIGTTAPTVALEVRGSILVSGTATLNGNTTIGDANTDTLTINAGTSGTGITLADSSFANCTLKTVSNVVTCGTSGSFTSFTAAGDTGSNQSITDGNTLSIAGGTNGIDTVGTATDIVTLNLDTTEIGDATFGSGSGFTWTFDSTGGTDTTIAFGNNQQIFTAGTASFSNRLGIGTTAPTTSLDVVGTFKLSGSATLSAYTNNGYIKTTGGTGTLSVGTTIPSSDISGTLFTAAGDSGSGAVAQGNTLSILATGNGIDTSESGTTVTLTLDTTEIGDATFGSGSGFTWTFDSTGGTDTTIAFGNNQQIFTAGTASFSTALGIGTTAPTVALDVVGGFKLSGSATLNGNTAIGDANTDTLTINAGTSGTGIRLNDSTFANCTLTTVSNVVTCGTSGSMSSFTAAGDTGSNQSITDGNTFTIAGGTNGIDTVGTATDIVTLNLDTTEIGSTTFGSGGAMTWTFDSGAGTDPTAIFGSAQVQFTAGTASFSNRLGIGTTAPTTSLDVVGTFKLSGSATLSAYTNNGYIKTTGGTGTLSIGTTIPSSDVSGTLFTAAGDSGSGSIVQGNTLSILATGNGIDTSESGTTVTLTLDTTEIGDATFGSGSGFTWTFDSGSGTDPSAQFASNAVYFTAGTASFSNRLGIGTTAPSASLAVGASNQFQVNSSGQIAAAAGISSSGTIAFSGLSSNGYVKTTGGTGTLSVGTTIPSSDVSGTLFTAAGDSGSGAVVQGNTLSILATGNGIDTSESGTTVTLTLDTTEIANSTFGSGSGFTWTFDSTGGTDTTIAFGNNQQIFTAGTASFSNRLGIGTTAPTVALDVAGSILVSGTAALNGNTTIGDANTDTLTINAGSSGTGITLADSSFANCTLKTVSNVVTCGTSGSFTSFTAAGDSGSNQSITDGNTFTIAGGTNGIDTVGTATDIVTLNLDTTEIGTTTFGSGGAMTWTFDSGSGTDPTEIFGSAQQIFTAGTASFSNRLGIGTTAPTTSLDVVGTFKLSGSATLSAYTNNGYIKTTGGTGTLSIGTTVPSSDVSGTLFTAAGDSGSGAIVQGNTLSILATGNGIDTSESGTTVTLTLDTTEIANSTFGSGSGFTWTFDAGATDPTAIFGSNQIQLTAGTASFSGRLGIGTTAPSSPLDILITSGNLLRMGTSTNYVTYTQQGTSQFGWLNSAAGYMQSWDVANSRTSIGANGTLPLSTLDVLGNLAIGSYAGLVAAPSNGLIASGSVGIGTSNPTAALSVGATSQFQVNSSGQIAAAAGISSSGTIAFSGLSSNGYVKTTGGTGTLSVGTTIPSTDVSGTLFTAAGDSGSGAIVQGNTLSILATGNGIDTSESGTTVTLTLDTTEIGSTTFGSGSGMTWTFNSGSGTDPTEIFGSAQQIFTAATAAFTGSLGVGTTAPAYPLDVVTATATTARFKSTGANNAGFILDNEAGGNQSFFSLSDAGTVKWQIGKQTDNTFFLWDQANSKDVMHTSGADLYLEPVSGNVYVGVSDTSGSLLVLDTKTDAEGALTGANGGMYYNSNLNKFRCYENSAWTNCIGSGTGMTSFTAAGDSGSNQTITDGNTLSIAGGSNGIDTVGTATDIVTLNLDTTEIGTTTFGSGGAMTWTFDSGSGTDPTAIFGSAQVQFTAGTASFSNRLGIGTTSPTAALEVNSSTNARIGISRNGAWGASPADVKFYTDSTGADYWTLGMAANSTNNFYIYRNTINALTIDSSNANVGIGTTAPAYQFQIGTDGSAIRAQHTSPIYGITIDASTGSAWDRTFGFWNSSGVASLGGFGGYGAANAITRYYIGTDYLTNIAVFDQANSRVGIGLVGPSAKLDVSLASTSSTGATEYGYRNTVADTGIVTSGTDTTYGDYISLTRTGATGGTINSTGLYITATGDNAGAGTSKVIGLDVSTSSSTADTTYAALFNGGNVGIGTTAPGYALDVAGVIRGQAVTLSGDVLMVGNDAKLVDADIYNSMAIYGTADTTKVGLKLGSGGPTLYGAGGNLGISGNVGIGITAPGYALDVASSTKTVFAVDTTNEIAIINSKSNVSSLDIQNGGVDALTISANKSAGSFTNRPYIGGNVVFYASNVGINNAVVQLDSSSYFQPITTADVGLSIRANSSQTADLFEAQNSSGTAVTVIDESGNVGIGTTNPAAALEVNGLVRVSGTNQLQFNTNGDIGYVSGSNQLLFENGSTEKITLQTTTSGNIEFNPGGSSYVTIGTSDTTASLLVLDTKTDAEGALTGTNGGMYYNSNSNKFRCYENGAWTNCIGSGTGMTSFTAAGDSGSNQTITDGNTFTIAGGTNGIDTVGTATDIVTLNLDTTEIGNTTFGSGSNFTWTFDSNTTDPTITFGNGAMYITAATASFSGNLGIGTTAPNSVFVVDDGTTGTGNNSDLPLGRLKEYFSTANYGVFEAQGFINIDGSFRMDNFLKEGVAAVTADQVGTSRVIGDYMNWSVDEAATGAGGTNTQQVGCSVRASGADTNFTDALNGQVNMRLDSTTVTNSINNWCILHMSGANGSTQGNFMNLANKWIVYYKVRLGAAWTSNSTANYAWIGAANITAGTAGKFTATSNNNGIWFSNVDGSLTQTGTNATAGSAWIGEVHGGTAATNYSTVSCSSASLSNNTSTSAWALMRIEGRATNDVHFFIDPDTSNGVSLSECGTGITSNIPTNALHPQIMDAVLGTRTTTNLDLIMDLFAFVQDDPRGGSATQAGLAADTAVAPAPVEERKPDAIAGADLAEHYYIPDPLAYSGDIVSADTFAGAAKKSSTPYDRKLLGVISSSPGLQIGESADKTKPIALSGRVPVNVSTKNGPIKIGDPITSSDMPGVGVKATKAGKIVGTALENYSANENGTILVNINVGYYLGDDVDTGLIEKGNSELGLSDKPVASLSGILATDSAHIASGSADLAKTIETVKDSIFKGAIEFWNKVTFKGVAEYLAEVFFRSNVHFDGQVEFSNDSAGYATIKQGERFVDVKFDKEYKNEPIVNISITIPKIDDAKFKELITSGDCDAAAGLNACQDKMASAVLADDLKGAVTAKTAQGFIILLSRAAPADITYSWQAVTVKEAKTSVSKSTADLVKDLEKTASSAAHVGQVAGESTSSAELQIRRVLEKEASQSSRVRGDASVNSKKGTIKQTDLGYVRLRSKASVDAEELDQIPSGIEVTYTATEGSWYEVTYKGKTGWVSGEYISKL